LSISYIKGTETKEEYLQRKYRKSKAVSSIKENEKLIRSFELYCEFELKLDSEIVIQDLIQEWTKSKDVSNLVNLLNQFHVWVQEDHPDVIWYGKGFTNNTRKFTFKAKSPIVQRNLMGVVRLYLRARTGIKISAEDVSEKITIPIEEKDREEYPLTLEQFQKIYDITTVLRRKCKYLFMRDTGCRSHESVQITKSMIEFDFDKTGIARVKMPKKIVKGKTKSRINFLTPETSKMVKEITENLDENESIFLDPKNKSTNDNILGKKSVEFHAFMASRESLIQKGFTDFADKHESGQHKIVLHSIRAFTATAISKGNSNNESLGHGYIGHKKYLEQYIRRSEAEQLEIFKNAIPYLTGIVKEYGESELALKVKEVESQNKLLHRELENVKKNGYRRTAPAIDTRSNDNQVILVLAQRYNITPEEIVQIKEELQKVVIPKE
tara:strand:- start:322 stop:1638 length:1317 start_codon:yes stop_codon:yes gene_type:complete